SCLPSCLRAFVLVLDLDLRGFAMMIRTSIFDLSRRAFLGTSALSLGSMALASLMARGEDEPAFKLGKATAKRVIMIFAAGGLSQLDLFDDKPLLNKPRGEELPDSIRKW